MSNKIVKNDDKIKKDALNVLSTHNMCILIDELSDALELI